MEFSHHGGTEDTEEYTEKALGKKCSAFLRVLLRVLRASVVNKTSAHSELLS
jgi:hypothetical protein